MRSLRSITFDLKIWFRKHFKKNCCDCEYYEWVGAGGLIKDGQCHFRFGHLAKHTAIAEIRGCGPGFWCCHFRRKRGGGYE